LTSRDPATLPSVKNVHDLPDTWLMGSEKVYKNGKFIGESPCISERLGDSVGVSWTPAGIRRHHNRRVEFTWGVDGLKSDRETYCEDGPWERDSPPTSPLWAVAQLAMDKTIPILQFPAGNSNI
jgi:hypothetical protein